MTDWGREIRVDGMRPAWLAGGEPLQWCRKGGNWIETISFKLNWSGDGVCSVWAIRLPADHWAYRALDAGFEPWPGGDNAPDDWNGGGVLWGFPSGRIIEQQSPVADSDTWTRKTGDVANIIGYHRKSEPTLRTSDEALRRMEALVRRMAALKIDRGISTTLVTPGMLMYAPIDHYSDAREIVKLLPEPPVDPDLLEARRIGQETYGTPQPYDSEITKSLLRAIKRGRELAVGS